MLLVIILKMNGAALLFIIKSNDEPRSVGEIFFLLDLLPERARGEKAKNFKVSSTTFFLSLYPHKHHTRAYTYT